MIQMIGNIVSASWKIQTNIDVKEKIVFLSQD